MASLVSNLDHTFRYIGGRHGVSFLRGDYGRSPDRSAQGRKYHLMLLHRKDPKPGSVCEGPKHRGHEHAHVPRCTEIIIAWRSLAMAVHVISPWNAYDLASCVICRSSKREKWFALWPVKSAAGRMIRTADSTERILQERMCRA